eukprot:CAMPEP_0194340150 /NCGR_PEP_ID=MMETSP0171-20130528/85379_1 /TAXON_ID=218684 /ORGANISM="Corethron pennatum, Strain L29A3" /LENGTH=56 /DNA_ID=CAMNT_0039104987 /DNA_START=614 /DNA_END=780 /DNA_ORIENTATION=+
MKAKETGGGRAGGGSLPSSDEDFAIGGGFRPLLGPGTPSAAGTPAAAAGTPSSSRP